jgi:hypothetical protein
VVVVGEFKQGPVATKRHDKAQKVFLLSGTARA